MEAFNAIGEAIHAMSEDSRLWRYPLMGSAVAAVMLAIAGVGSGANLVNNHPNIPLVVIITIVLLVILIKVSLVYYPAKAFQYRTTETEFSETRLALRSIPKGIITVLLSMGYGIVLGLLVLVLAIPFIVFYYIMKGLFGPVGSVIGVIAALPLVSWGTGVAAIMVPAYILSEDPGEGFSVVGTAFNLKKEFMAFGGILLLITIAVILAAAGVEEILSWTFKGLLGALVVGSVDGAVTGVVSALSSIAGAAMYRRLSSGPVKMGEEVSIDPDWLASL